jgi:hypothetical protein
LAPVSNELSRQTAVLPINTAGEPNLFPTTIGGCANWGKL